MLDVELFVQQIGENWLFRDAKSYTYTLRNKKIHTFWIVDIWLCCLILLILFCICIFFNGMAKRPLSVIVSPRDIFILFYFIFLPKNCLRNA